MGEELQTEMARAAEELRITAQDLYGFGVVERVISEAEGFDAAYRSLRDQLDAELNRRMQLDVQSLLRARYERFRKIGADGMIVIVTDSTACLNRQEAERWA